MANNTAQNIPLAQQPIYENLRIDPQFGTVLGGVMNPMWLYFFNEQWANSTGIAYTPNGIAYINSAGKLTSTTAPTNGQLLIGRTGNPPNLTTLTAGPGITISNGPGTIEISGTGLGTFSAGTTGLQPAIASSGNIVLSGTLSVGSGGTGQNTFGLGQIIYGSGAGVPLGSDTNFTWAEGTGLSISNLNGVILDSANAPSPGTGFNGPAVIWGPSGGGGGQTTGRPNIYGYNNGASSTVGIQLNGGTTASLLVGVSDVTVPENIVITDSGSGPLPSQAGGALIWGSGTGRPNIYGYNAGASSLIGFQLNGGSNYALGVSPTGIIVPGTYTDSSSSVGTSGQVLTSTGTGTAWADSTGGGSPQTPFYIPSGQTFTVETDAQVLFKETIVVDGLIVLDGTLVDANVIPTGPNNAVQYNVNGAFTGSSLFEFDPLSPYNTYNPGGSPLLKLYDPFGYPAIGTKGDQRLAYGPYPTYLLIQGGNGGTTVGSGDGVNILAGNTYSGGSNNNPGSVSLTAGSAMGTSEYGGNLSMQAGTGSSTPGTQGGIVNISSGNGSIGGDITIISGYGTSTGSRGGNFTMTAGPGYSGADGGNLTMAGGVAQNLGGANTGNGGNFALSGGDAGFGTGSGHGGDLTLRGGSGYARGGNLIMSTGGPGPGTTGAGAGGNIQNILSGTLQYGAGGWGTFSISTFDSRLNTTTTNITVNAYGAIGLGNSVDYGTAGQVLISQGSSAVPVWSGGYATSAPTTSSYPGTTGQYFADSNYIYVCIGTNSWVRSAASTF